jgi:D-alanyl-D-alanine carboxypeptidase (penicillin-binding protein 5/6)
VRLRVGFLAASLAPLVAFSLSPVVAAAPPAVGFPQPPPVDARAVVILDARTGQLLYAYHPEYRVQPASLAKIMTFDLALKAMRSGALSPHTLVTIGMDAWKIALNPQDSRMFLEVGQKVPMRDLLIGLMVPSGDDAAVAVADAVAGSQRAFVAAMNAEARRLGLTHTHFANASGLGAPGQYTTAMDMAILARHVVRTYPDYWRYTDVEYFTWNGIRQRNFNRLVGVDPTVLGLKSGHLTGPNFHLVTTARQGPLYLIGVVLGAPTLEASASESQVLLHWAFSTFRPVPVPRTALPSRAPVYAGTHGSVPLRLVGGPLPPYWDLPKSWPSKVQVQVTLRENAVAPVAQGTVLGQVDVRAQGRSLAHLTLVAAQTVPRGNWLSVLWGRVLLFLHHLLGSPSTERIQVGAGKT